MNTLEYVASPLANLDSPFLDVTPEEREFLLAFKDNGHQRGIMLMDVEELFRGKDDAYVGLRVANETPSTYYNFEITDPDGLAAALDLPAGHSLAPTRFFEGGAEGYYLTLSVFEVEDAIEGMRAQWSVYVDDGSGRPHQRVLDLMTADVGIDPVSIFNLPSEVRHGLAEGVLSTRLSSAAITFDASFETAGTTDEALTMDWIESGDNVCYTNGICDKFYYDAGTLDTPVHRAADVTVNEFSTPWSEFVSATPAIVFYRDNAQQYAVKRWHNLEVEVEVAPIDPLDGRYPHHQWQRNAGRARLSQHRGLHLHLHRRRLGRGQSVDVPDRPGGGQRPRDLPHLHQGHLRPDDREGHADGHRCQGPALMCSNIVPGSEAPYTAQDLNASNPDIITWKVNVEVDLTTFGMADSASTFTATRKN